MADLAVHKLYKNYGSTQAVRGIDLAVPANEFAVLVGPSGCGKSTLLRTIAGLEEADGGRIEIGGRDVTDLRPKDRDIAMVFQNYALYPYLTVFENIAFGLRARRTPEPEVRRKVARAADMLGLGPLLERFPRQLSGGQRQRVAIGRAIVRDARLFLFDEPLSNLDAQLRDEMRGELKRLHRELGKTFMYVTHDQIEAMTLADRIVVLKDGSIEQQGTPLDLFERPQTRFVAGFIGSPQMNFIDGALSEGALCLSTAAPCHCRKAVAGWAANGSPSWESGRPTSLRRAAPLRSPESCARPSSSTSSSRRGRGASSRFASATRRLRRNLTLMPCRSRASVCPVDFDLNRAVLIDPETNRVLP
jgi:multiple sugar transport system ATP-binding protein